MSTSAAVGALRRGVALEQHVLRLERVLDLGHAQPVRRAARRGSPSTRRTPRRPCAARSCAGGRAGTSSRGRAPSRCRRPTRWSRRSRRRRSTRLPASALPSASSSSSPTPPSGDTSSANRACGYSLGGRGREPARRVAGDRDRVGLEVGRLDDHARAVGERPLGDADRVDLRLLRRSCRASAAAPSARSATALSSHGIDRRSSRPRRRSRARASASGSGLPSGPAIDDHAVVGAAERSSRAR